MKNIRIHSSKIELVPLKKISGYEKNARKHSPEQIATLVAVIKDSGFTAPLIIDGAGVLIAGHGRLEAAKILAIDPIPCVRVSGLTKAQITALRLSDNQLGLTSSWDMDMLKTELGALQDIGFDLSITGFADLELGQIGVPGFELQERLDKADETPEPPKVPVVKSSEIWILGDHRLLIGDCTVAANVERLLAGAKPHLMVTDPPYGVEYDPNWRNEASRDGSLTHTIGATATGKVMNDGRADWTAAWKLFSGDAAYVWHASGFGSTVQESLAASGLLFRSQIIWNKDRMIIGRGDYHWKHEACFYVVRKGKPGHFNGDRKQTTVWDIAHRASDTGHGTQKPIDCMRRPILNNSRKGDAVYDPFLGSGTTLISCEMEGRRCFGLELDPVYGQVIIERFESFSGKTATREDGATLEDLRDGKIAKKRLKEKLVKGPALTKRLKALDLDETTRA